MSIALIAGLGNPGEKYNQTRHNVGFWLMDALFLKAGESPKLHASLKADLAKARLGDATVRLAKPTTFMNESGQAIRLVTDYFNLSPAQVLIVHDEIDLPPGALKLKRGGGHGGHNGLRDIINHIGNDFLRLRIGVGHPGNKADVVNYVLKKPSSDEHLNINHAIGDAVDVACEVLSLGFDAAAKNLHTK